MFNKLKLIKAIVYRIYSSIITFIIAYLLTKNLVASISIGIIDSLIKIFSYYAFDEIWAKLTGFKTRPAVIFLTGLSGSGKTTLAEAMLFEGGTINRRGEVTAKNTVSDYNQIEQDYGNSVFSTLFNWLSIMAPG